MLLLEPFFILVVVVLYFIRWWKSSNSLASMGRDEASSRQTIVLQSKSRFLLQILQNRIQSISKSVEIDYQWVEFDDVRYHIQASVKNAEAVFLSVLLPAPPPLRDYSLDSLPVGAIEAIKAAFGSVVQILDPPRDGFDLTMKINLSKFPANEESRDNLLEKIASVRELVLGAPLREILKHLAHRRPLEEEDKVIPLVHRPNECYFILPQRDKVIAVFPMRFKHALDAVLASSFLQDFDDVRRMPGLANAPLCSWSASPPPLLGSDFDLGYANAGFVSFVILPRHVDGKKLDRAVWNLSTFHAYVSYHVKSSEGFMHTRMRRRVEAMIQALEHARLEPERSEGPESVS